MTSFEIKVFSVVKKIPRGKVSNYSLIATAIENKKAYRAVGNVLKKNTDIPTIPCHRVIKSDGRIGGYILGKIQKKKILGEEGIQIKGDRVVNLNKVLHNFS